MCHRITESSRLEKPFKIKSNHRPGSWSPITKPCPLAPHLLNASRDGDSTDTLGSPPQCPTTPSIKKFFLMSILNLPWCNLRPRPHLLPLCMWEKRLTPSSLQSTFRKSQRVQVVAECTTQHSAHRDPAQSFMHSQTHQLLPANTAIHLHPTHPSQLLCSSASSHSLLTLRPHCSLFYW